MKKLVVLGWSVCSGIRWSVSTGNDGQFAPEIGGQFDRIFQHSLGVVLAFERWETALCVIACLNVNYIASFLAMTQCAVIALGKAKTAGALAERWLGWAQKGQR